MEFTVPKTVPRPSGNRASLSGRELPTPVPPDGIERKTIGNSSETLRVDISGRKGWEEQRRQDEFRRHFALPSDYLIDDYTCALRNGKQGVLAQGRLYISDQHLAFTSVFLPENKIVPLADVTQVKKRTTAYVFSNAIDICTKDETLYFASFLYRDDALEKIRKAWGSLSGKELLVSDGQGSSSDGEGVDFNIDRGEVVSTQDGEENPGDPNKPHDLKLTKGKSLSTPTLPRKDDPSPILKDRLSLKTKLKKGTKSSEEEEPTSPLDSAKNSISKGRRISGKVVLTDPTGMPPIPGSPHILRMPSETEESGSSVNTPQKHDAEESSSSSSGHRRSRSLGDSDEFIPNRESHVTSPSPTTEDLLSNSDDEVGDTLLDPAELQIPLPPLTEQHPDFHDEYKRASAVQRELQCSPSEFFRLFWANRSFLDKFFGKLGYTDTSCTEWKPTAKPGAIERKTGWSVSLAGFAVGPKNAIVEQTQKAKFKNEYHLEIETSGRSSGVPFSDAFTAEEKWDVIATSTGVRIIVEAGVYWTSSPWGAALLKGTIEEASMKSATKNGTLFLDMAAEVIEERRKLKAQLKKGKSGPAAPTSPPASPSKLAPPSTSRSTSSPASVEKKKHSRRTPSSPSVLHAQEHSMPSPLSKTRQSLKALPPTPSPSPSLSFTAPSFLVKAAFYIVLALLLITFPMLLSMSRRLSFLEQEVLRHIGDEKLTEKVAFLEYFLEKVYANLTTDESTVESHYHRWRENGDLLRHIAQFKADLDSLSQYLISERSPSRPPLANDVLLEVEQRAAILRAHSSSWFSLFMNGVLVVTVLIGMGMLGRLYLTGQLVLRSPFVFPPGPSAATPTNSQ